MPTKEQQVATDAPGGGIPGSLGSADGTGVVGVEDRFHTDIDDLWSAFTALGRLARWYGQLEGDLRPPAESSGYTF
jgi:hypothetical protein